MIWPCRWCRLPCPICFFISLVAFAGGILNAHGRFVIPALTPVFSQFLHDRAAIWLAPLMDEPACRISLERFLPRAWVQLVFQIPVLIRLDCYPARSGLTSGIPGSGALWA